MEILTLLDDTVNALLLTLIKMMYCDMLSFLQVCTKALHGNSSEMAATN